MTPCPEDLSFLPYPQSIQWKAKSSRLPSRLFTKLAPTRKQLSQLPAAISLGRTQNLQHNQAYRLAVEDTSIRIEATTQEGYHYGLLTLKQLAENSKNYLPQCTIEDWPDFENRGVMLDISRNKVPTLRTLLYLIDHFAEWKITQLQLYIEHTFAYRGHDVVWKDASPLTVTDIQQLDTYCKERFIELVPNLNCFGHMHRWLIHDRYKHLAECPDGGETDFGYRTEPQGLSPAVPESIDLAHDLIHQLIPCFQSKQINVGCDETIDLGYGRSKKLVEEMGRGRVYLDHLKKIHHICTRSGHTMQFWADILLKYPELIPEVPTDAIALAWGYEASHPFAEETKKLQQVGSSFYVCPGTSSWNSIGGRTTNMLGNINQAAEHGKAAHAVGLMVTDWGDNGHLQPLAASFPGLVHAAKLSWKTTDTYSLEETLDKYIFRANGWGKWLLDIGNLETPMNISIHNRSILFSLLQDEASELRKCKGLNLEKLTHTLRVAESLQSRLTALISSQPTEAIIQQEMRWVVDMLQLACQRGLEIFEEKSPDTLKVKAMALRDQHKRIWQARNRPGGYKESHALFDILITGQKQP